MLAFAISALFTLTGIVAVLVIADSLVKARATYAQLMLEAAVMTEGMAVQAAARALRQRPAPRRTTADRRSAMLRAQPRRHPACAAA